MRMAKTKGNSFLLYLYFFFCSLHRASSNNNKEKTHRGRDKNEKYKQLYDDRSSAVRDCTRKDVERDTILNRMLSAFYPKKHLFLLLAKSNTKAILWFLSRQKLYSKAY